MDNSKITFKTHHSGQIVKFSANFGFPLSRKEIKGFEKIFHLPYTDKLAQYQTAIDKFSLNQKKFSKLLQRSEIQYNQLPFKGEDIENYNRNLRKGFINSEWRTYNRFFMENPAFKKVVIRIVKTHLEEDYSMKIRESSEYSLKEDLPLLIRDKKKITKKLQENVVRFRKELLSKIKRWEVEPPTEQPFFPSIITNSGFTMVVDKFAIEMKFNLKKMYENILKFAYGYNGFKYREKEISITEDKSCIFNSLLILIRLPKLLEAENLKNRISYSIIKDKSAFKFDFDEVLKDLCKNFIKERRMLKPAPASTVPLKKKILKNIKVAIPVSAILALMIIFSILFINIPSVSVEKYDSVKLDYTVWVSDEGEDYDVLNPDMDMIVWLTIVPITENSTTGIVLGLYNNILGKEISFDSGLVWLNKCIDQDRNGIDDNTGQVALTYGNSTDLYFNTCLMIQFRVLDIQKNSPSYLLDIKGNIFLGVIGVIAIVIGSIFAFFLTYIIVSNLIQKRRLRPKLISKIHRSRKVKMFKYGILTGSLPLLLLIILTIMNSVTPIPELLLSSKYNPLVLPALFSFMVGICVIYALIFLVLFNIAHDRIKKK